MITLQLKASMCAGITVAIYRQRTDFEKKGVHDDVVQLRFKHY